MTSSARSLPGAFPESASKPTGDGHDGLRHHRDSPRSEDGVRNLIACSSPQQASVTTRNRRAWRAVEAAGAGADWQVTFRADVATRHRGRPTSLRRHTLLVSALLAEIPPSDRPVAAIRVRGQALPGRFIFFVYLLQIHGGREGRELFRSRFVLEELWSPSCPSTCWVTWTSDPVGEPIRLPD